MKKIFKFAAILTIAAFTLSTVSCSKDDKDEEKKEEPTPEPEPEPEDNPYADWDGAWSIIGDFNGWAGDVEMTKSGDWYVGEFTVEGGTLEFKFRRDAGWDINLGLAKDVEFALDNELTLAKDGANLKLPKAGVYKCELKPTAPAAKITFVKDIEPTPSAERVNVFHITPELSENWLLANPIEGLASGFTVEVRFFANSWNTNGMPNRLIALEGKGEHPAVMLRFSNGDKAQPGQLHLSCDDFFGGAAYSPQVTSQPAEGEESGAPYIFETGMWHDLAVTYNGSEMSVYDNGELVNTYTTKLAYDAFTIERIEFGMSWEYSFNNDEYSLWQLFLGYFDYVRVWNKPLAASEIAAGLCDVASNAEGLCGYWAFDDATDSTILPDRVGKNNIDWTKMSEMDGAAVRKTLDLGDSFKNAIEEFDGAVCE